MSDTALQYIADEHGDITAVVVPIDTWRQITAELETQHLLRSPAMRQRLLSALSKEGGYSFQEILDTLGMDEHEIDNDES